MGGKQLFKAGQGVERAVGIKAFLVLPVAALHHPVVPGRGRAGSAGAGWPSVRERGEESRESRVGPGFRREASLPKRHPRTDQAKINWRQVVLTLVL